jgi:hypothetical protein
MTDARKILEMIENVAVDDVAALDEIGYPNLTGYVVTRCGSVISTKRNPHIVMRQHRGKHGYMCVTLRNAATNNSETHRVHRLMAMAFCENPNAKPMVLHRNGNQTVNDADNLYWGTHAENVEDMKRHGSLKGLNNPRAALKPEQIEALKIVYPMVPRSLKDQFANMFDVHPETIKRAIHGATWK